MSSKPSTPTHSAAAPLYSSYANDPEMGELIEQFVEDPAPILHTSSDRVDPATLETLPPERWTSLQLIRPRDLSFLPRKVDAEEALRIGLVARVFPAESFRDDTDALVAGLLKKSPSALRGLKENYVAAERMTLGDFVDYEAERHLRIAASPDTAEAFRAFLDCGYVDVVRPQPGHATTMGMNERSPMVCNISCATMTSWVRSPFGSGVSELRIDYGPGYRVYFSRKGKTIILLLCGGDKRTQQADIERAIEITKHWTE